MSSISTHVLNLANGSPAAGLSVALGAAGEAASLATALTDQDGRVAAFSLADPLAPGEYWLWFDTGGWFAARAEEAFYPEVEIRFRIDGVSHYHVPLLLSPYGYSTYRGS